MTTAKCEILRSIVISSEDSDFNFITPILAETLMGMGARFAAYALKSALVRILHSCQALGSSASAMRVANSL
jgi:hypothetical protein